MKVLLIALCAMFFLSGCVTTAQPTYYYGAYPQTVYSYFKADGATVTEQIDALNQIIEQASSNSLPVAPGLHAHLGMLYFEIGNGDQGLSHFELEKALFPESTAYIDFLIKRSAGDSI